MKIEMAVAAVSMKTALRYSRRWKRDAPIVKVLQSMMRRGPGKKGYRLYLPIGEANRKHYTVPPSVRSAVKNAGFVITDYLAKKCVKLTDVDQKNVFNIGKVIAKDPHAKMAFDNDPQLQNSKAGQMMCVISCHPYDIIGMSTGRDWDKQSCMRLDDGVVNRGNPGAYNKHVRHDIAEGTMVAYAIAGDDTNITKPKARCLLKPFLNENADVLYRQETHIYGNNVPGFAAVLSKFLREINKDIPDGTFVLPEELYDDGAGQAHEHARNTSGRITPEEYVQDSSVAVDFIRQEVETIREQGISGEDGVINMQGVAARDAIVNFLKESDGVLKETQIAKIAEMLKGVEGISDELTSTVTMGATSHLLIDVARRLGALKRHSELPAELIQKLPTKILTRMGAGGGHAVEELVRRLETEDEDDSYDSEHMQAYRAWFSNRVPVPTKDILDKYPKVASRLQTIALAARHMPLFDLEAGQQFAYDIIDEKLEVEKEHSEECANFMYNLGGTPLYVSYIIDNIGYLGADALYMVEMGKVAQLLKNRRPFRLLDKSTDGQIQSFMEHVKMEQIAYVVQGRGQDYKDHFTALRSYLDEQPEVIGSLVREWDAKKAIGLAEFHLPAFMHLVDNGVVFTAKIAETMNGVYPFVRDYKGEPLIPESVDTAQFVAIMIEAAKLLPEPVNLERRFDPEHMDEMDIIQLAEKYQNRMANQRYGYEKTMAHLFARLDFDGQKPDIMNAPDLVEKGAPLSFSFIRQDSMVKNARGLLKMVRAMSSLDDINVAISSLMDNSDLTEPDDEREYVNDKMQDSEIDPEDHEAYAAEETRFFDEVERKNQKTVELNAKLLTFTQSLMDFVGMEDEEDDDEDEDDEEEKENFPRFAASLPNVDDAEYSDNSDIVNSLREELQMKWDERQEYHDEYKQIAGYD